MKRSPSLFRLLLLLALLAVPAARPATAAGVVVTGRISDAAGAPVEGAEVFLYDTPRTRRPADFISPRTGVSGVYRLEVPPGRYWAVARLRDPAATRPFEGMQRHSGEATELEAAAGEATVDFTVAEARDVARRQRKPGGEVARVKGRILDREGRPVPRAYTFAVKEGNVTSLPDFLSAPSDDDGGYELYVPPGSYCLGGALVFPPENDTACRKQKLDGTTIGVAIDVQLEYLHTQKKVGPIGGEMRSDD